MGWLAAHTTFYWCEGKKGCSLAGVPAAFVAPLEMLMFPKALPAPSNLPGNRHAIRCTGALFLRLADGRFFSPAHKLSAWHAFPVEGD